MMSGAYENGLPEALARGLVTICLLYTSDAADERSSVDLGGRRIIKKKKTIYTRERTQIREETSATSKQRT